MKHTDTIMVCCGDVSGQIRGKGFPADELHERRQKGVGWTYTNTMINAFNEIAPSKWGAFGDLFLKPDWDTHVSVRPKEGDPLLSFVLADVLETDGRNWSCCPRFYLKRAIEALKTKTGLSLKASFEHEFYYSSDDGEDKNFGFLFSNAYRHDHFMSLCLDVFHQAKIRLDSFFPEYGMNQFEFTLPPNGALKAADQAIQARELFRFAGEKIGNRVSFSPLIKPEIVGNGVHIHFSLQNNDIPVNYDADKHDSISDLAVRFIAGILAKGKVLPSLTASSDISYSRLQPHRWSAAYTNLGNNDREALVRICPVFGSDMENGFHFEYRAADSTANPYLALGSLIYAGLYGIEQNLPRVHSTSEDIEAMDESTRTGKGIENLPGTFTEALNILESDKDFKTYLGEDLRYAFITNKRSEIEWVNTGKETDKYKRYREIY